MATATATATLTASLPNSSSSTITTPFPSIETVFDDDDSSYEEYIIEEELIEEEEDDVIGMLTDMKKVDEDVGDVKMPPSPSPTMKMPPRGEKGVDDSTVTPPPQPAISSSNPFDSIMPDGLASGLPTAVASPAPPTAPSLKVAPAPVAPPPPPPPDEIQINAAPSVKSTPMLLSPSKQRAKAASSAGLSELSKQLRVLHAKNESQAQDISRLERQLRILADLQGISVSDLRKALEDACASEAFGELQNRVQKLKYELEAATLAKQAELGKDTAAAHIANLELRIGELEELEEKRTKEVHHLYEQIRQERAKSTRLESENVQLKKELEDLMNRFKQQQERAAKLESQFQDEVRKFQEEQTKKMQEQLRLANERLKQQQQKQQQPNQPQDRGQVSSVPGGLISPEMAAEYERMVQLLKEREDELRVAQARLNAEEINWSKKLRDAEDLARKAQMDLQVEFDKLAVTNKELEDADGQNGLRLAQYKARFTVQDERIDDLEQQLDSLYVAFTLLKEEFDSENQKHAAMLNNLNDADAEIARQANASEKRKSERHSFGTGVNETSNNTGSSRDDPSASSVPYVISAPTAQAGTPSRRYNTDNQPSYTSTPTPTYASAEPYTPSTPDRSSSTWQLLFPEEADLGSGQRGSWLIHGPLIVESKGMLRKWKTKASKIYLRGDRYQWDIGSKQSWPLQFGITKVEFNPNHSLSFVVYLNPNDTMAPMIRAATSNERDYRRWMTALTKATTGEEYGAAEGSMPATPVTPQPSRRSIMDSPSSYNNRSMRSPAGNTAPSLSSPNGGSFRSSSNQYALQMEDQEAADLRRALELSKQQM